MGKYTPAMASLLLIYKITQTVTHLVPHKSWGIDEDKYRRQRIVDGYCNDGSARGRCILTILYTVHMITLINMQCMKYHESCIAFYCQSDYHYDYENGSECNYHRHNHHHRLNSSHLLFHDTITCPIHTISKLAHFNPTTTTPPGKNERRSSLAKQKIFSCRLNHLSNEKKAFVG